MKQEHCGNGERNILRQQVPDPIPQAPRLEVLEPKHGRVAAEARDRQRVESQLKIELIPAQRNKGEKTGYSLVEEAVLVKVEEVPRYISRYVCMMARTWTGTGH